MIFWRIIGFGTSMNTLTKANTSWRTAWHISAFMTSSISAVNWGTESRPKSSFTFTGSNWEDGGCVSGSLHEQGNQQ